MSNETLRKRIALISRDSARVVTISHAKKRMVQRRILLTQVLQVLNGGKVVEPAHRNIHGNWQCTLERLVAGDRIKIVAALEERISGEHVIVITVMN